MERPQQDRTELPLTNKPPSLRQQSLRQEKRCTCTRILCWTLWITLALVFIVGIVALILYFVYKPSAPTFDITYFHLESISIKNGLATSAAFYLSAVALYTITGYNPNKVQINYNYVQIDVQFNDVTFANSTIPAFYQSPGATKEINGTLTVEEFPLTLALGPVFLQAFQSGTLPLKVVATTSASINILGITSPSIQVTLTCNISVNLNSKNVIDQQCSSANINL